MLKSLKRLFRGNAQPPESDATIQLSDDEILAECFSPSKREMQFLGQFLELSTAPLDEGVRARLLARVVADSAPGDSTTDTLTWALARNTEEPEEEDLADWWLCVVVDVKDFDQLEWQADKLLATLGIVERWRWVSKMGRRTNATAIGLLDFDAWLTERGYCLLYLDTGGDEYFVVPVARSSFAQALELANQAGLDIRTAEEFKRDEVEPWEST